MKQNKDKAEEGLNVQLYLRYRDSNQIMIYIEILIILKVLLIKNHFKKRLQALKGVNVKEFNLF